ncbi:MAG: LPS-assembly protein LptD [Candidatus Cloacimonetes bacterium]|nr:LPS-assembly protein LptD [Candidatus Cloacimonadota bacterium]
MKKLWGLFLLIFILMPVISSAQENPDTTATQLDSLDYTAKKIIYHIDKEQIKLIQKAYIRYHNSHISSDSMLIDLDKKIALSYGESELYDGEQTIYGSTIYYNIDSEQGLLLDGRTKFEDGYYAGSKMIKVGDDVLDVDNAKFTTCEDESQYFIFSPKFRIFLNEKIVAKPIILYINYFPVFVLPFATFPINQERRSGFLIPEPGWNNTEGKFLKDIAYFLSLGDYADMLFSLDLMEYTGVEFRYRTRYIRRYILDGRIDSRFLYYHEQLKDDYRLRWSIDAYHKHVLSPYSDLQLKADFVSDADIRKTSDDQETRMDQSLHSYIFYSYRKDKDNFNTTLDYKKDLVDLDQTYYSKVYYSTKGTQFNLSGYCDFRAYTYPKQTDQMTLKLPSLSFRLYQMNLAKIFDKSAPESSILRKLNFSYNSTLLHYAELNTNHPTIAQLLYKDTYDSLGNYISEHREGIKHSLSLSYTDNIFKYFDFTQSLNYNEILEDKDKNNKKLVRGYDYNSTTKLTTDIYGVFTFPKGRLRALRHIITPSITYTMHPDFSSNDRFYNFSLISISTAKRSEKISIGLTNKLQAKVIDKEGKEKKLNDLFTWKTSLSYDFQKKPKGFSTLSHTITTMPFNMIFGPTTLNISNSFKGVQDFYTLIVTNYSLSATLSLKGNLDYLNYYPVKPTFNIKGISSDEECCNGSRKSETKPWDISSSFSYSKNTETGYYSSSLHNNLHVNLTKNWSIGYSNYYNFKEKELISQSINIYRNLHCWQLKFSWDKSGDYWSYRLEIQAKKLPDLRFLQTDSKSYY